MKPGKLYRPNEYITIGAQKWPLTVGGPIYYLATSEVFMYVGPVGKKDHRFLWQDILLYVIAPLDECCHEVGKQ